MSLRIGLLSVLITAFLSVTTVASISVDQVWRCFYKGTQTSVGSKAADFTWVVTWVGSGNSWMIKGRTENSETMGSCKDFTCNVREEITTGKTTGQWYYWIGTYQEQDIGPGKTINTLSGTWGSKPEDRKSGGTFKTKATCTLVP